MEPQGTQAMGRSNRVSTRGLLPSLRALDLKKQEHLSAVVVGVAVAPRAPRYPPSLEDHLWEARVGMA